MTHDEIKVFIAARTREGHSLSKIQDMLAEQGVKMTFMELLLIASEIETAFWQQAEPAPEPAKEEKKPEPAAPTGESDEFPEDGPADEPLPPEEDAAMPGEAPADGEAKPRGRTTVTLDQLARPGFLATGGVQFGSGASGNWCLDQMGRLMFEKLEGKPDRQDLQEFQLELQRMFAN